MVRVQALVGVAVCLLAVLIGCKSAELGGLLAVNQAVLSGVYVGSPAEAALSVQASLEKLNLKASLEQDSQGSAYYLTCKTKNGARFKVVLTSDKSSGTEQTHVRLDWLDARDDSFGLHLLADVKPKT